MLDASLFENDNKPIEVLNLSVRTSNCLHRSKIHTMYDLLILDDFEALKNIRSMGVKSYNELVDKLSVYEKNCGISDDATGIETATNIEFNTSIQHIELCQHHSSNDFILSEQVNELPYDDDRLKSIIISMVNDKLSGYTFDDIISMLPTDFDEYYRIRPLLSEMIYDNLIQYDFHKYHIVIQSIDEVLSDDTKFSNDNQKTVCQLLLQPNTTLESVAKQCGITRERVRQIYIKWSAKKGYVFEDLYSVYFETYDIPESVFKHIFGLSDFGYSYLQRTYKRGVNDCEELLVDSDLTSTQKHCIIDYINRDYIVVSDDVKIRRNAADIVRYITMQYAKDTCNIKYIQDKFVEFCQEYDLPQFIELANNKHKFKARLSKYVLNTHGFNVRYYDINQKDLDFFFEYLNFEQYQNVCISADKLFDDYIELMNMYDIRSGEELHNFMKKCNEYLPANITLTRMPNLEIGNVDRDKQVIDLLFELAPVSMIDLANEFQHRYGVKAQSVMVNWVSCIDKYMYKHEYVVDFAQLSNIQYSYLKQSLVDEFYFIDDVIELFQMEFPNDNSDCINSRALKALGFRQYSGYMFADKYQTIYEYIDSLIPSNGIFDIAILDKRILDIQAFRTRIYELCSSGQLFEFERNKYIPVSMLNDSIDIDDFVNDILNSIKEPFFNIHSLRQNGCVTEADDLGFDDWFYNSLIKYHIPNIKFMRTANSFVFTYDDNTISSFVKYIVKQQDTYMISWDDFVNHMYQYYGLQINESNWLQHIKNSSLYYDNIMKTIYLNKDEFYKHI